MNPIDYQQTLATIVIPNMSFEFNSRPAANIKHGLMYNLKNCNSHVINGLQIHNLSFFDKQYGSSKTDVICCMRGFAHITNNDIKEILIDKIKKGLLTATSRQFFTDDCDIIIRLNNLPTCVGCDSDKNLHYNCFQAKHHFEKLNNVKLHSPNGGTPCLFNNFLHSHKEFNKLQISPNHTVCNEDNGSFVLNDLPNFYPNENIYCSFTNKLSGLINIRITAVYIKNDNIVGDTIRLWCTLLRTDLLTPIPEINW